MRLPITNQLFNSRPRDARASRRQLLLSSCLVCLSFLLPPFTPAQTSAPPSTAAPSTLPSDAQAALKKGILATQEQEWLIAIQSFQDARKNAPNAPVLLYNLGLAESKIPGRELRAIAWFGAYLAVNPNAPNATGVNDAIAGLQIKNQGNLSRLIQTVEDAADRLPNNGPREAWLENVMELWAKTGNITAAVKYADSNDHDAWGKVVCLRKIAVILVRAGDIPGARQTLASAVQTANLLPDNDGPGNKSRALESIATDQANAGDITDALAITDLVQNAREKSSAQIGIAYAQIKAGDIQGAKSSLAAARRTAELIQMTSDKARIQVQISDAQVSDGDISGAKDTLASALTTLTFDKYPDKTTSPGLINERFVLLTNLAIAQSHVGDISGAQESVASARKVADLLDEVYPGYLTGPDIKDAQDAIKEAQEKAASTNNPVSVVSHEAGARAPAQQVVPVITVSDWLERLDDTGKEYRDYYSDCHLNTDPFLDLSRYLTSSMHSDNPREQVEHLSDTAEMLIKAQEVINRMLKQQAKQEAEP